MMKVWTAFLLVCAAASAVAWVVALCHENRVHENRVCPFRAAAWFVRGLPWGGRLAVFPLFVALVVYGSVKQGNVANVEVLPVTNTNTKLEIETENWQHSHTGNTETGRAACPQAAETDNGGALGRGEAPQTRPPDVKSLESLGRNPMEEC